MNRVGILNEVEDIRRETFRIGKDKEMELKIGYLRCYSGQELHQAVAEFSRLYPEVSIFEMRLLCGTLL